MPSFDVVSEVDAQEVRNAVDQASRELGTRFDFRNVNASFDLGEGSILMTAEEEFQLGQMYDLLVNKLVKRKVDTACLEKQKVEAHGKEKRQRLLLKEGIDKDAGKKIVKALKEQKLKVQAQIQGDQVRVTGKKRDDLQAAIAALKELNLGLPLSYSNFRD
ncbi:MAG: YajQ family cyclic di-GMP-binding protein [Pseudomonadota bacterium]